MLSQCILEATSINVSPSKSLKFLYVINFSLEYDRLSAKALHTHIWEIQSTPFVLHLLYLLQPVLLGGGRKKFLPANPINPSWGEGERRDERNLVMDWHRDKAYRGKAQYVSNRKQLLDVDIKHTDYLLGLFQPYHMLYHLEEGNNEQPTLTEMTEVAIRMLQKNKRGYYLFVEGGKIDQAHHKNYARMALDETVEFHKAIQRALEMVDEKDTLVVVTADHSHTLNMVGYPLRGDDILGGDLISNQDNLPYTTLSYANGPSAEINRTGLRRNISNDNLQDIYYQYPSMVNRDKETHGGEDVAVFARGPWAHLLTGNFEQNFIPHVMQFAARIAPTRKLTAASSCGLNKPLLGVLMAAFLFSCRLL
ncbi:hypothetical protein J6590_019505 [Homalodisca vitripennis]|nr:hypothetical protein J6590_019505 [Homalodisca vitripennis]